MLSLTVNGALFSSLVSLSRKNRNSVFLFLLNLIGITSALIYIYFRITIYLEDNYLPPNIN